jgi:hypothetical protein
MTAACMETTGHPRWVLLSLRRCCASWLLATAEDLVYMWLEGELRVQQDP